MLVIVPVPAFSVTRFSRGCQCPRRALVAFSSWSPNVWAQVAIVFQRAQPAPARPRPCRMLATGSDYQVRHPADPVGARND
jgi:hypothetical protein